jgi:sugar phosphate isomerase/epimerase
MLRVGLNPYGLTWTLGLQGRGTPRTNPAGRGLDGFLAIADDLGAHVVEIFDPWLQAMPDDAVRGIGQRLAANDQTPIVSAGLNMMGPMEAAFRSADLLGATTIRLGLSPILCGDRNAFGLDKWEALNATIRAALLEWGPRADDAGYRLAIENHQDFTSDELVAFCELTRGVCITFDTGNAFPVAEAPLDFTATIAPHVRHVHLKDYRVQFTDEGFRLVRCAIGDGAVPFPELIALLTERQPSLTAVLEPGALEARHVRLFTTDWWNGYAPKTASQLSACLRAARVNRLPAEADYRTPWERGEDNELELYELDMIRRSAANMRALGIMEG